MCDQCEFIGRHLSGFRQLLETANDPLAIGLLVEGIKDMEAEMFGLHPQPDSIAPQE
jgi:hypothetical protein